MKKKQIIGLGTLLLVCLLGLFTTSYANITENQLKNYAIYIGVNKGGKTEQYMIDWLETATWTNFYNPISTYIDNDNYEVLLYSQGTEIYFYYRPINTTSKLYIRTISNYSIYAGNFNGRRVNTLSTSANNSDNYNSWSVNNLISNSFYTDLPIYSSDSYTSITFSGGTCYPSIDILEGPYQDSLPFTFIPKPADEYADVYYFEDIPLYNASGEDLYLGQLFEPFGTNVVYWTKDNYYFRYGDWNMRQLPVDSIYLEYFITDNDVAVYDVYLQSKYIYENTIYSTVLADGSSEPYTLAYTNFYIKNNNTIVANGVLDTSRTFSGDYKDKYDNDLDNQEDVNNISQAINDTINQPVNVSGELGAVFSGDIYDIADSMGFDSTVSIYFTFIEDFLKSVCNVLVDDNDVYFDYSMHGETPTRIYSSDIVLPNGHPLKIFISIVLVFLTVYLLYFQFMKLFEALQTADLSNAIKSQDVSFYIFKM